MLTFRGLLIVLGVGLVLAMPLNDAFGQRRRGGGGGGMGGGMGGGGMGGGGMMLVNPALAQDQQDISNAQKSLALAQDALQSAVNKATSDFHRTPDYVASQKAIDQAAAEAEKARTSVLAGLKTQPNYRAVAGKESEANAKLAQLRASGADRQTISAQSLVVLKAGSDTSKLEREALDNDQAYKDAMKKLADAHAAQKTLDDNFLASLKGDTNIATLTQKRDDARTQLASAKAKLQVDQGGGTAGTGGAATPPPGGATAPAGGGAAPGGAGG